MNGGLMTREQLREGIRKLVAEVGTMAAMRALFAHGLPQAPVMGTHTALIQKRG